MSTMAYFEPHKFSAGVLALVVHAIFFSLLFFGFNWHAKLPESMMVEMWDHLPDPVPDIVLAPPPPPELPKIEPLAVPKAAAAIAPAKADIELKDKKKKKNEPVKKENSVTKAQTKQDEKAKQQELELQRAQTAQLEADKQRAATERSVREDEHIQQLKTKMRAEMDAAAQGEVARYKDLIRAKISRNIVMPPDVSANAEAVFLVIVLPGGAVMDNVKLLKSSGNAAYDSAAERAIYKSQPLPLPQNASLARMFRELRLSVKP
jgi:colicin import membrane protein